VSDADERLVLLETRLADFKKDLVLLRALIEHDHAGALNKLRYVTEKVLHRLCREFDVSWGKGEPTLENMIGPLVARRVIPKNVAIHVRTVQTNASPGSHFQEDALDASHVHVAQLAFLDFLEWYYTSGDRGPVSTDDVNDDDVALLRPRKKGPFGLIATGAGIAGIPATLLFVVASTAATWSAPMRAGRGVLLGFAILLVVTALATGAAALVRREPKGALAIAGVSLGVVELLVLIGVGS
jgi:hypothetical protein